MNFGEAWKGAMGTCAKDNTFEMLDFFKSHGGNFIDTANNYQNEESETWLGEWMAQRDCRDQMVIATKYTTGFKGYLGDKMIQANHGGNNAKSMKISVEASLKKLQTDYIDILYVHWWSYDTPIEEVMHYLNDLVVSGKVIYLGISDTPAWIVSKANTYARAHGLRPFVVYQGQWSAAQRSFEREIIPMCRAEGMAIAPWGALGGGMFKTEEQFKNEDRRKMREPTDAQLKLCKVLEEIANRKGTVMTSIALAYVLHKTPHVFPICGGRSVKHLEQNIQALGLKLTREDIVEIDDAYPFERGFPYSMLAPNVTHDEIKPEDLWFTNSIAHIESVPLPGPLPAGAHKV